ncbi:ComEA family DNA-binding protein [Microbacterium sp. H1-D42]|uniref:helix-hairpin-helix domain-containing protein n=1 Tax=Microbacterium sp. H1-D42 TaxID=2925844 RepID=UPI001F536149|nr:ComEA family DNA-binding protein [Microbacterium sp. H1-D42]UNK72535.1 ComEA family DNA-binding protein [Microbacterium sp. H1-D42]
MGIGVAVTLGLVVLSAAVGWGILRGQAVPLESIPAGGATSAPSDEMSVSGSTGLYVHVLGEVTHPGLYILDADARLVDALAAAGGTLQNADLQAVNLARPLSDGEQIIVPAVGAEPSGGAAAPGGPGADGKIDLNTADQAALETLPRIGPALAQRILDWREENGRFRSVDDLLAVPGIGDKLLAGVREKVRV